MGSNGMANNVVDKFIDSSHKMNFDLGRGSFAWKSPDADDCVDATVNSLSDDKSTHASLVWTSVGKKGSDENQRWLTPRETDEAVARVYKACRPGTLLVVMSGNNLDKQMVSEIHSMRSMKNDWKKKNNSYMSFWSQEGKLLNLTENAKKGLLFTALT
jgi:hypothetical protein